MTAAARREAASTWCLRVAGGNMSPEDEAELDVWLAADPDNRAVFERMASIWLAAPETADTPEMIAVRADALEAMRAANERRWSRRFPRRFGLALFLSLAAALLMTVAPDVTLWADRSQTFRTGIGERQVVRLEDGSHLSLDAATAVKVDYGDKARTLHLLSGRAKFDVAKDASRPFTVTAGGRTVVATGTSFSVELIQRQMRVVLYEGHVRVLAKSAEGQPARSVALAGPSGSPRPTAADQELKPGTVLVASFDRASATVQPTELQRSLSWEGGQLVFTDDPLAIAAERINRYTDTPIVVEGAAARLPVSGAFNAGDPAGFIDGVSALYPLRVTHRDGKIVLAAINPES